MRWLRHRHHLGAASVALLLATLPVQAIQAEGPEPAIRAEYRCKGRFDVVDVTALMFNQEPAEVILLVGESATRLRQLPAASGARYGSGSQIFWIKGDHASWSFGSATPLPCESR
jgi:membrane-bound inhibitor of C-type lysozyme